MADRNEIYRNPLHPYTKALLSAVPIPDPVLDAERERVMLSGEVPSPLNPPSGCVSTPAAPWPITNAPAFSPNYAKLSLNTTLLVSLLQVTETIKQIP